MFTTKIKSVLAVILVFGLILCGIGAGVGLTTRSAAVAQQPQAKPDNGKKNHDKAALAGLQPKQDGKAGKEERKVLTPEEAIKLMSKENVTVQFKVASVEVTCPKPEDYGYGAISKVYLKDGGKLTAGLVSGTPRLKVHDPDQMKKLGIKSVQDFKGKMVRVTGRVEPSGDRSFLMWVRDVNDIEVVKE